MGNRIVTGNEAYHPRAKLVLAAMRGLSDDQQLDFVASELRREFGRALHAGLHRSIDESSIAASLTSAAARLIGLATRDGRVDDIDRCVKSLVRVIDGLEEFALLAGSDTGAEPIQTVLRELVGYMRERDYEGASAALVRRTAAANERETVDTGAGVRCDQCGQTVARRAGGIVAHRCPHGVECILEPGDPRIGRGGWGCGVCRAAAAAGEFDERGSQ